MGPAATQLQHAPRHTGVMLDFPHLLTDVMPFLRVCPPSPLVCRAPVIILCKKSRVFMGFGSVKLDRYAVWFGLEAELWHVDLGSSGVSNAPNPGFLGTDVGCFDLFETNLFSTVN